MAHVCSVISVVGSRGLWKHAERAELPCGGGEKGLSLTTPGKVVPPLPSRSSFLPPSGAPHCCPPVYTGTCGLALGGPHVPDQGHLSGHWPEPCHDSPGHTGSPALSHPTPTPTLKPSQDVGGGPVCLAGGQPQELGTALCALHRPPRESPFCDTNCYN